MKKQQHHQDCPFCKWVTKKPSFFIEENQNYLSLANISPDSEGHVLIITKKPCTNITELTEEEWKDLLPILKSTTNRINNIFNPQGFNLYSNAGAEGAARQAVFHFHLHVVPEWKGNRGVGYLRKPWFIPNPQKYQEIADNLQTKGRVIKENNKAIAQLVEREQASDYGHVVIINKKNNQNDLNQLSEEAWNQMGELLRENIKKIEENLEISSLRTCIFLGKIGGLNQEINTGLQIHLVPRYKAKGAEAKEDITIPLEVVEVANKLRQAGNKLQARETLKIEVQVESKQEQNIQQQITIKNLALENLINSAKEKLKSQSKFLETKRKDREQKLNSFFKNFPTNQDEFVKGLETIKKDLSKKLNWGEINEICETKAELTKLQVELENLQQSQLQTQILQPTHNN